MEDLIKKVIVGKLDLTTVGEKEVEYRVVDSWGRSSLIKRKVTVYPQSSLEYNYITIKNNETDDPILTIRFDDKTKKFVVDKIDISKIPSSLKNEDKKILDGLNLEIKDGEIHAIMGPNGTGKSTLSKTIMGHFLFNVLDGDIIFNDVRLNELSVDERAKAGIFLAMQDPTVVDGVTNSEFLKNAYEEQTGNHIDYFKFISEVNKSLDDLKFSRDMIHRDVNAGFSGGEKKKNEVLQIKMLKPKLIILDEIDSGLDVDSLKIVCENINEYKNKFPDTSILIITHYPRILEAIKPDYVHIMKNGKIVKTGDLSLALETEQVGYNE